MAPAVTYTRYYPALRVILGVESLFPKLLAVTAKCPVSTCPLSHDFPPHDSGLICGELVTPNSPQQEVDWEEDVCWVEEERKHRKNQS